MARTESALPGWVCRNYVARDISPVNVARDSTKLLAQKMNTAVRIALWTALLLGGAKLVSVVTFNTGLAGSGAGVGAFAYWFQCKLEPDPIYHGQDKSVGGLITIEGRAPSRFKFDGGISPAYEKVSLEWILYSGGATGRSEGQVDIDLRENRIRKDGEPLPLEPSSLARVLAIDDSPANAVFLTALFDFLTDCRSGNIPRPRHHPYSFEDPIEGQMQHFAMGPSIRYPVIIWFSIWLVLLVATHLIPWLTSRRWTTRYPHRGSAGG